MSYIDIEPMPEQPRPPRIWLAAVLFAVAPGWARKALRPGRHVLRECDWCGPGTHCTCRPVEPEVVRDERGQADGYGSMILAEERTLRLPDADQRAELLAALSPEALDDTYCAEHDNWVCDVAPEAHQDSGPGGPFSSAPGPDPCPTRGAAQGRVAGVRLESRPAARADLTGSLTSRPPREDPGLLAHGGPGLSRLADTGEIRDAHLLAEVAAELRAQDDDARAYCSALERDRQTYMHELREVFA